MEQCCVKLSCTVLYYTFINGWYGNPAFSIQKEHELSTGFQNSLATASEYLPTPIAHLAYTITTLSGGLLHRIECTTRDTVSCLCMWYYRLLSYHYVEDPGSSWRAALLTATVFAQSLAMSFPCSAGQGCRSSFHLFQLFFSCPLLFYFDLFQNLIGTLLHQDRCNLSAQSFCFLGRSHPPCSLVFH